MLRTDQDVMAPFQLPESEIVGQNRVAVSNL
jgi:hypothetical protein